MIRPFRKILTLASIFVIHYPRALYPKKLSMIAYFLVYFQNKVVQEKLSIYKMADPFTTIIGGAYDSASRYNLGLKESEKITRSKIIECLVFSFKKHYPDLKGMNLGICVAMVYYILKKHRGDMVIQPDEISSILSMSQELTYLVQKESSSFVLNLDVPYVIEGGALNLTLQPMTSSFFDRKTGKLVSKKSYLLTAPDGKSLYTVKDALPRTIRYNKFQKSKWSPANKGYFYVAEKPKNAPDWIWKDYVQKLETFIQAAEEINRLWSGKIAEQGPQNKKYGVLGWDVKYKPAKWVQNILPEHVKFGLRAAPRKERHPPYSPFSGEYYFTFSKSGASAPQTNKRLRYLNKHGFERLLPIYFNQTVNRDRFLKQLDTEKYDVFVIGWGKHARFAYINSSNHSITVFDPWKNRASGKEWTEIVKFFQKNGWSITFDPRNKHTDIQKTEAAKHGTTLKDNTNIGDQGTEGTCTHISIMRALVMHDYGIIGARIDVPDDYAMAIWLVTSYIK